MPCQKCAELEQELKELRNDIKTLRTFKEIMANLEYDSITKQCYEKPLNCKKGDKNV